MLLRDVALHDLAQALSCHPRTLFRLLTGASNPYSKKKAIVSLTRAGQLLNTDPERLSRFLMDWKNKTDEAVDIDIAAMILSRSERQIRRLLRDKQLPTLAHFGHTLRFSSRALKQIVAAR